ncbi:hypothetical protein J3R83DRAFT_12573 [Lanmaoa asiatica]|nr:hypothetical protein J3R83DRAFT_12573 [Lanmaoa asiatica]
MLFDNYCQALRIIKDDGFALEQAKISLRVGDKDLQVWRVEQSKYLDTLGQESEWDAHAVAYVEMLQKLREARISKLNVTFSAQKEDTWRSFLSTVPENYVFITPESSSTSNHTYSTNLSQTRKLETARRHATERFNVLLADVAAMELKMGITRTWEPTDEPYVETMKYIRQQQYHCALRDLQRLVVLRLMELHKMNLGQAGYRMRTQIAKSLQSRCKAIQNAIKTYNNAAAALEPPAPALEWSRVSHYGFLEEFTLLKKSRQDVRTRPWAQPAIREAMRLALRVERAKEEITRCNIELRRLHSAIDTENQFLRKICKRVQDERHPLQRETEVFAQRRMRINSHLLSYIYRTFELAGFTGDKTIGRKVGVEPVEQSGSSGSVDSGGQIADEEDTVKGGDNEWIDVEEEENGETVGRIVDYISELPA